MNTPTFFEKNYDTIPLDDETIMRMENYRKSLDELMINTPSTNACLRAKLIEESKSVFQFLKANQPKILNEIVF